MWRGLAIGVLALLAALVYPFGLDVAEALPPAAGSSEAVFGAVTGTIDDPGTMTPTGDGRFTVEDRVFAGKSLARSVLDDAATCLTGQYSSTESWALDSAQMTGSHRGTATIHSERGTLSLRLRGRMEFPSASGSWEITKGTGDCAGFEGEGTYSATYPASTDGSPMHLTFEGQAHT